ncbi:MAG: hypothetical protein NVSMB31_05820 [Vulcanimicrobiaceae bacterium]
MELLDRYLQSIKSSLPQAQRDDIAQEISAEILCQVDEKENELSRPLNRDEEATIIKRHGHPRIVASRYAKQQQLIGPILLPFYWYTLRIVLIAAVPLAFLSAVGDNSTRSFLEDMTRSFTTWWSMMLASVGAVTIVFTVIERVAGDPQKKLGLNKWDPRNLPPASLNSQRFSFTSAIFELIMNGIVLVWLISARAQHAVWPFPSTSVEFAPVWNSLVNAGIIVVGLYLLTVLAFLVRPALSTVRISGRVAYNMALIFATLVLLLTPTLVSFPGRPDMTDLVRIVLRVAFAFAALIAAWEFYCDARFLRPKHATIDAHSTPVGIL